jgi:serine/threonine protein kinase
MVQFQPDERLTSTRVLNRANSVYATFSLDESHPIGEMQIQSLVDDDHEIRRESKKRYGRHGDINPGNILWYDDTKCGAETLSGTLKLADFGQAEVNSLKSRTKPRSVANTLTYRPPECDRLVEQVRPTIRQTYDIWCLGCVYLEFVTWMLGGDLLLRNFISFRTTEDYFQNNSLTDTFFQVVRNHKTDLLEVAVKEAVIEVRREPRACHLQSTDPQVHRVFTSAPKLY